MTDSPPQLDLSNDSQENVNARLLLGLQEPDYERHLRAFIAHLNPKKHTFFLTEIERANRGKILTGLLGFTANPRLASETRVAIIHALDVMQPMDLGENGRKRYARYNTQMAEAYNRLIEGPEQDEAVSAAAEYRLARRAAICPSTEQEMRIKGAPKQRGINLRTASLFLRRAAEIADPVQSEPFVVTAKLLLKTGQASLAGRGWTYNPWDLLLQDMAPMIRPGGMTEAHVDMLEFFADAAKRIGADTRDVIEKTRQSYVRATDAEAPAEQRTRVIGALTKLARGQQ